MGSVSPTAKRYGLRYERGITRLFNQLARNPLRWAMYAVLTGLLLGGAIFSFVEAETSLFDGVWWAFVSMTTVGYGDIAPKSAEIRMLATFVIATGIAATAILTAALAGRVAEARLSEREQTIDLDDDFDDLLQQVQALKQRYVHDERYDDMLGRCAHMALQAWRGGERDHRLDDAMEELGKCLESHPEAQEHR